jgi:hypothetical protein
MVTERARSGAAFGGAARAAALRKRVMSGDGSDAEGSVLSDALRDHQK